MQEPGHSTELFRRLCRSGISFLSGLELTIFTIVVLVLLSLVGAWIPQENSADQAELLAKYGSEGYAFLKSSGLTNVYQSLLFLSAVGLLFVNLAACTVSRMIPRIRSRVRNLDFFSGESISKFSHRYSTERSCPVDESCALIGSAFASLGYGIHRSGSSLIIEKGKYSWLAAPVTHHGLFVLIAGVVVSACSAYSGRVDLYEGQSADIKEAVVHRPLVGKIADLQVKLLSTRRENNSDGSPRQWFSKLELKIKGLSDSASVFDVSVNNPVTFESVDLYQSDWKLAGVKVRLADEDIDVPLSEMGHDSMGVVPVSHDLMLIFALKDPGSPLRLYFKHAESNMPRLFATLKQGETTTESPVPIKFHGVLLQSGIQFKSDPGLPVNYTAFFILMIGACFVALPGMRIWASVEPLEGGRSRLIVGFNGLRTSNIMRRDIEAALAIVSAPVEKEDLSLEVS